MHRMFIAIAVVYAGCGYYDGVQLSRCDLDLALRVCRCMRPVALLEANSVC